MRANETRGQQTGDETMTTQHNGKQYKSTIIVSNIAGCRVHLWVADDGSGIWIDRHGRIYEDR